MTPNAPHALGDGSGSPERAADPAFVDLLLASHLRLTGEPLCPVAWRSPGEAAAWLYEAARFGLLAHEPGDDPLFVYANRTAQERFEYGWDEFVRLRSALSARPDGQEDRDALIRSVAERGYATGYRGRRVSGSGRLFWIEQVTMWNLVDAAGEVRGQAAVFRSSSDA